MPTDESWERNFPKVTEFALSNGHCNIPSTGATRYLAKWLRRIRKNPDSLDKERRLQLEQIGVDWNMQHDKNDIAWNDLFQRLLAYKKKNGDCDVPSNYREDPELGTWVSNQRRRESQKKLRQDRKELLHRQGFRWTVKNEQSRVSRDSTKYQEKWMEMFERLKVFKQEHGNCNVPYNYKEDTSLGMWVQTQRRVYHKTTYMYGERKEMSEDRINLLKSIGFDFGSRRKMAKEESSVTTISINDNDGDKDRCRSKKSDDVEFFEV